MGFFDELSWRGKALKVLPTLAKCGACGLYKGCQSPKMPYHGKGKVPILFVGEAPGKREDEVGRPFVGDAGDCVRGMLSDLDLDMDDCWVTNSAICRPPKNVIEKKHVEYCRPNVIKTIQALKPKVIVLLGGSAVQSVVGAERGTRELGGIGKWAGSRIPSQMHGAWLCPTYHPSYVLREGEAPVLVKIVKGHLRRAIALATKAPPPQGVLDAIRARITLEMDPKAAMDRLRDLAREKGNLTLDYETTGLKPERAEQAIFSVAWCLNGGGVVSARIDPACYPLLAAVCKAKGLIKRGANIKFEERWSRVKLGTGVRPWGWDTMLAAHVLDNREGITSVKHQTYVQFGVGDYAMDIKPYLKAKHANAINKIDKAPLEKVLVYGGFDAIFEDMLVERQMRMFGD